MKNSLLLFIMPLLLICCGIKQPTDQTIIQETGSIFVTSQPPGASILLDRQATHKATPDTLHNIPVGTHVIHVTLPEFTSAPDSQIVVVEDGDVQTAAFTLNKIERIGAVTISSVPTGAEILINDQPTGQTTPDTLTVEPGVYSLTLIKNGFEPQTRQIEIVQDSLVAMSATLAIRQRVLLEGFANVSCDPCVEASHNLDRFRKETPAEYFAMIEYYANWPSPNDPFYKVAPEDAMKRVMYYKLTTLPSLFINGATGVDASRYENIESAFVAAQQLQNSQTAISLTKHLIDGQLAVDIEIYQFDAAEYDTNWRLFVAITEDNIHFDAPPGSNGLQDFSVVFRGFLSDRAGDAIEAAAQSHKTYETTWPGFNYEQAHIVAFIQNVGTKKIIQSTIN